MQNNMMIPQEQALPVSRTLDEIKASIYTHAVCVAVSYVAIGRDLIEAKAKVAHGQWLPWLREVGFSPKRAEDYMRLAREVQPDSTLASFPYSKALALLDVPSEEREQFMADNQVEDKSAAEIRRLIAEVKAQKERAANAENARQLAVRHAGANERRLDNLLKSNKELRQHVEDLESRPPERITVETISDDYETMKRDFDALRRRCEEAEEAAAEAEERASSAVADAQRVQMAQADEEDAPRIQDGLTLQEFVEACNDFQSKVWYVPHMREAFCTMDQDSLRGFRIFAGGLGKLAEQILAAIDAATIRPCIVIEDGGSDGE